MKIGILAVQGAFSEQELILEKLHVPFQEIRCEKDLQEDFDGLILPGGESTVQGKLLKELNLFHPLLNMIQNDVPVLATCAGMILLSEKIDGQESPYFKTIPMNVKRNAYGRQLGSFHITSEYKNLGRVPMTFIRAPYVINTGHGVSILSQTGQQITAVQYRRQTALAFHPELDKYLHIHRNFLEMCSRA
ncbi:MAG: pyridoxal 5'-phosphate synthase glutaminase subunit PdxT [Lachnospiraceae bacterium]|nr:pyridoxal 5'-phosphate synthase glutaminase subunit PdxT [Lachnospiraceae bacterium]